MVKPMPAKGIKSVNTLGASSRSIDMIIVERWATNEDMVSNPQNPILKASYDAE